MSNHMPTPPESLAAPSSMAATTPNSTLTPPGMPMQTPIMSEASLGSMNLATGGAPHMTPPQKNMNPNSNAAMPRAAANPAALSEQKPLPTTMPGGDWFAPLPQFVSPYNIGQMSNSFFSDDALSVDSSAAAFSSAGQQNAAMAGMPTMASPADSMPPYGYVPGRQGSLTHSQQLELMNVLETEGAGDIDAFMNAANNMVIDGTWY